MPVTTVKSSEAIINWQLPDVKNILDPGSAPAVNDEFIEQRGRLIQETLASFGAPVQVVCGAPNARSGMKGVFAPVGSYVPGTDLTLKAGKIRGEESNGMLVSERELGLSDEHEGIIDLPGDAPLGAAFADYAGLNDPVIEIAGAVTTPFPLLVADLARLARREVTADFHCVAGWSATNLRWEGVAFQTLYREFIEPSVPYDTSITHVVFEGVDGAYSRGCGLAQPRLAEVQAARELAHQEQIHTAHPLRLQRRGIDQLFVGADRAQVGPHAEATAQVGALDLLDRTVDGNEAAAS